MMKRLTGCPYNVFICMATIGLSAWMKDTVDGLCVTSEKKLLAMITPTTESFTDTTENVTDTENTWPNEGESCQWTIRSFMKDGNVKLTFPIFRLKNSTKLSKGDCLEIFDGGDDDSDLLDKLCDKIPQTSYTSTSREMLVIYTRGDLEGYRQFSMTYWSISGIGTSAVSLQTSSLPPQTSSLRTKKSSTRTQTSSRPHKSSARPQRSSPVPHTSSPLPQISSSPEEQITSSPGGQMSSSPQRQTSPHTSAVMNTEKIIRIVGIIGAVIAAAVLTCVVLKATKCCICFRKKDNSGISHAGSSIGERVRLARSVQQDGENGRNMQISTNNQEDVSQPLSPPSNNSAVSPAVNRTGETANEDAHDSDTDSLQDMNEIPPSYESLYLNELGEPVSPPKYSPPVHRSSHPPRRVHTFN